MRELTEPAEPNAAPRASGHGNDAFWSWLGHELRSPLNACVMWVDVLALSPQPDKVAKAVEAIRRNLDRQARLVSQFVDAAKVSSGGLELRVEPLDLVALVKRNLDAWQSLAFARELEFHHRIELEAAPVVGDAGRLTQALNHLIEAAVGSTPAGGRVDLRAHAANGSCVVEVADTGASLSPEDVANLAVPLWRAATTARTRSGIGLGLAVAHHLAAQHGGSLTALSGASGGRFVMTVPFVASDGNTGAVLQKDRPSGL